MPFAECGICLLLQPAVEKIFPPRWFFFSALVVTGGATTPAGKLAPVSREKLCVTEGVISELPGLRLAVNVPKMRAYLNAPTPRCWRRSSSIWALVKMRRSWRPEKFVGSSD
jgi:hypothetical protein